MEQARLHKFERRCIQEEPAECVAACPLHVDARSFVMAMARGDWAEAWKILRKAMPLPAVLGRICDHPCEARCRRRDCGEAIRVGALERACVQVHPPDQRILPLPRRAQRVAAVGSGLSSLTFASDLARKGYPVTVYEPADRIGGPLLGFPEEVLPSAALESELAVLRKLGVDLRVGEFPGIPALRAGFDAVFVGLDAGLPGLGRLPGEEEAVFVGGETLAGAAPSPVGWAFAGRRAAVSVDRMMQKASLTVGREKEGPQQTRLVVSLAGVEPLAAVRPADPAMGYSVQEAQQEAERCLRCECLECVKVCEYLKHFGSYPRRYARDIYNNSSIVLGERKANLLINSCMLCDLCTTVCPEAFSMPDLCLEARREMVRIGKMPPSAYEFALEDHAWSHGPSFALARQAPEADTTTYAFFPGCQLAGSDPAQVEAVYAHLRERLPGGVGLILDCCGAPVHWAGREDLFEQGVADVRERWQALGCPTLIFACPTCYGLLGLRLEGAESRFLTQVLEEVGVPLIAQKPERPLRALHDPCTTRHHPALQQSARRLLGQLGQPLEELALSQETTECCGYGGLEANAFPELARRVAARRAQESPLEYVTYCAMCRDSLAATGKRVVHMLDLVFPGEGDSDPAARPRPGWSMRREHRALLRERLLAQLWDEGGRAVEPWQAVQLLISQEVQARLDERRILLEDVQQVIHHAETTEEKLCHSVSGHFLASHRPRLVTFWVEYSPAPDGGFQVHNAYGHRMTAGKGV